MDCVDEISRPYGPGLIEAGLPNIAFGLSRRISRPYGPGLIEAKIGTLGSTLEAGFPGPMGRASLKLVRNFGGASAPLAISRPYGPGLIEAAGRPATAARRGSDFPALWAGPH